jgi:hypothetical protein
MTVVVIGLAPSWSPTKRLERENFWMHRIKSYDFQSINNSSPG